jgi:hypothetical protein
MPDTSERAGRRPPRLGARARVALSALLAFVIFNAVFDVRLLMAVRDYVAAAESAASGGTFLRVRDSLDPAARQGLYLALAASAAMFAAGLAAAARSARVRAGR